MDSSSEVLFPCLRCGKEGQLHVGQSVFREELRWYESLNCDECGLRTEADGIGFPPACIRERIVSINGNWKLELTHIKSIPAVAKVLREHLSLGAKEVLGILRAQSGEGVYRGTKAEVLWLSNLLEKAGEAPQISLFD